MADMSTQRAMNKAQDATFTRINNRWPIATYELDEDGDVQFECDNGDPGIIRVDGSWDWTGR